MRTSDTVRQVAVLVSAGFAIVASFIGSGAAGGTPIDEVAGGALSADATPIAPAGPAFAIWSVIYAGLVAYTIWQLFPAQKADARQRRLGYPIAASLVLNGAWILSVQFDLLALSVPVIVALLVVLVIAFRICLTSRPGSVIESIVADGTVGLYLGWVCVATAANITAWLASIGFTGFGIAEDLWAVVILGVAGAVGVLLALHGRGRITPALSLSWGLAWVAVGRLAGDLLSTPAAATAIIAMTVVLLVTAIARIRARSGPFRVAA